MTSALEAAGPARPALESLLDSWDKERQGSLDASTVNAAIALFNVLDRREDHLAATLGGGEANVRSPDGTVQGPGIALCPSTDGKASKEEAAAVLVAFAAGPLARPLEKVIRTFQELAQLEAIYLQWAGDRSARLEVADLTALLGLFNKWTFREYANVGGSRGRVMLNYYDRGTYGMEVTLEAYTRWLWDELRTLEEEFGVLFGTMLKRISDFVRIVKLFKLYDWDELEEVEAVELVPALRALKGLAPEASAEERAALAKELLEQCGAKEAERGVLDAEEIRKWIRGPVAQLSPPLLDATVAQLHEFARGRITLAKVTGSFRTWDTAGKGTIERADLRTLLSRISDFSNEEMEALMDGADKRKDGHIDYREFAKWVLSAPLSKV